MTALCGAGCGVPRLHRPNPDAEPQAERHVQEQTHQDVNGEKGWPDQQRAVRRYGNVVKSVFVDPDRKFLGLQNTDP
jgi:hypothetical protein